MTRQANIPSNGCSVIFTETIPIIMIERASIDPTDKSIPAVNIGNNIPTANKALMDDCRAIFIKLFTVKTYPWQMKALKLILKVLTMNQTYS